MNPMNTRNAAPMKRSNTGPFNRLAIVPKMPSFESTTPISTGWPPLGTVVFCGVVSTCPLPLTSTLARSTITLGDSPDRLT